MSWLRTKHCKICELEKVPDVDEVDRTAASKQGPVQHIIFESSSSSEENTRDVATPAAEGPAQHVLFDSSEDDNGQRVDTAAAGMYGRLVRV